MTHNIVLSWFSFWLEYIVGYEDRGNAYENVAVSALLALADD